LFFFRIICSFVYITARQLSRFERPVIVVVVAVVVVMITPVQLVQRCCDSVRLLLPMLLLLVLSHCLCTAAKTAR
jgi:Sec-independent protein secretion pathway component TatC